MLVLAACKISTPPVESAPLAAFEPPPGEQRPLPPHPAHKPFPPAAAPALAALPAPATEPTPPPAPSAEVQSFDKLEGLDQSQTVAFLGQPLQRAEAPPAVLWRYASRDCALDVYFYLDLESREMRVLHYEVRNTDGNDRPQQRCYGELVTDRRPEQTGSSDSSR